MDDRFRLLLIDDNPDDRLLIRRALTREFAELEMPEVGDPGSLARAVDEGPYDLVITDYGLGFTDGLTLLETLKAQWPDCPVILCTGTLSEEIAVEALRKGLDDYVLKDPRRFMRVARGGALRHRSRAAARGGPRRGVPVPRAVRRGASRPALIAAGRPHRGRQRRRGAHPGLSERRRLARRERGRALRGAGRPGPAHRGPRAGRHRPQPRDPGPPPGRGAGLGEHQRAAGEGSGRAQPVLRVEPHRYHGAPAARVPAPPGPEDGGGRPARGRGGPRLQQPPHRHRRALLPDAGEDAGDDPLRREVELVRGAAERAARLTHQLLAFSRKQVLEPRVLDLDETVSGIEPLLRRLIGEHIEIVVARQSGLGHVKADAGQLEQVILNLSVNARDAMPQGGRLTLETADVTVDEAAARRSPDLVPGRYVVLSVRDTGHGMDAATRAQIFEPFFTTKEVGKGTGLGLATVYGIVKQSGGLIEVESEPGQGACFKVYLPRVEETVAVAAEVKTPGSRLRGTETVLLVEDDESLRTLAREILTVQGYTVVEAASPREALRLHTTHPGPLHLLLTDVVMPEMNGRQLADQLKTARADLRVLFMSGYTGAALAQRDGELGGHFLPKPFTPDGLSRRVREVLDG